MNHPHGRKNIRVSVLTKRRIYLAVCLTVLAIAAGALRFATRVVHANNPVDMLVSVNSAGTGTGNNQSQAYGTNLISDDGRYVAFVSYASNLVANDTNNQQDVFVRDRQTGTTTLVSINSAGTDSGNNYSDTPVISADGRYVAFYSNASNLVANDTNSTSDVFVRDRQTNTTTLVSVNSAGTATGNNQSYGPAMSADGRYVAFQSYANNLVAGDTNNRGDIFVRDLQTGTTSLISINSAGTNGGNSDSYNPVITPDGRFVLFTSVAGDLAPNDTNGNYDLYVRNRQTSTTTLVSVDTLGQANGNSNLLGVISANGRYVAFQTSASNVTADSDTNGTLDIFRRDLQTSTTTLVSINSSGTATGNGQCSSPAVSQDGRYVSFSSNSGNLVANDNNGTSDAFVRDVQTSTTTLVSVNSAGTGSGNSQSNSAGMTPDGRYVLFIALLMIWFRMEILVPRSSSAIFNY